MDKVMEEFIETLNKEISSKAKVISRFIWDCDNPEMTKYIKDKLHEIDQLIDIRTKLLQ